MRPNFLIRITQKWQIFLIPIVYSLNLLYNIYLQFSGPNLLAIPESHHTTTSSHLNKDQAVQNAHKLTSIAKTYGFNSLSETVFVHMEALHKSQKEGIGLLCSLIESLNLSEVQKALKRDSRFKAFAVKYVQDMVKNEISAVISNLKLSISSSKISPDAMEGFFMLTINNKYARSAPILQSLLRALTGSIGIPSHFFHLEVENLDANNKSNESEAKTRIELKDEMNRNKLICQTKRANSQCRRDIVPTITLCMLSYARS